MAEARRAEDRTPVGVDRAGAEAGHMLAAAGAVPAGLARAARPAAAADRTTNQKSISISLVSFGWSQN